MAIIGIGGIGTYAVQIARALGATVAAIDVDPDKLARAAALGARWAFNPRETDAKAIKKAYYRAAATYDRKTSHVSVQQVRVQRAARAARPRHPGSGC